MVSFPNCKINLGLRITGKRSDGFHNLETLFYPVNLTDALEIVTDNDNGKDQSRDCIKFSSSGIAVDGNSIDNICIKAYQLIHKNYPHLLPVKMHLHKAIPIGAGLGGGSSDGAFVLKLLNSKYNLGLSVSQLVYYALQLGSDCPFFIVNKPVIATGRGEIMKDALINLSAYNLVIVNPGVHINTGWAFSQLVAYSNPGSIDEVIKTPLKDWKHELINDFEVPVMQQYPGFRTIKERLYQMGALYASMSGSGSSFYGIFEAGSVPDLSVFPVNYLVKEATFL